MRWPWVAGKRREQEIDEEIQAHLRLATQDRIDRGESPSQARASALRELGKAGPVKEDTRAVWTWTAFERLGQDLKYTLRQMRRSPGFTAVAVLTLAFGLSVNITIFSLIGFMFRQPLPVKNADRLVVVLQQRADREVPQGMSWRDYQDYRAGIPEFSDMLAISFRPAHLSIEGRTADRTWIEAVSGNYFSMLGISPLAGRFFQPGEGERQGADPVAVLSYDYWQSRLGGDPGIVGRSAAINGHPFTIIGITPQNFTSARWAIAPSAFIPAAMIPGVFPGAESILTTRHSAAFKVMAHLQPGLSEAQATSAVQVLARRLAREYRPDYPETEAFVLPEMLARPEPSTSRFARFAAIAFLVLAGLVLFIACANVANLMFSRAVARQREIGIRAAIGAPRRRLVRQLLTESIALAMLAGAVGMLLSYGTGPLVAGLAPPTGDVPVRPDQSWSWLPSLYTLLISLAAGVITGFVPALRATKVDVHSILKGAALGIAGRRHLFRSGLVLAQVALCVVVLVCGGLFVLSLREMSTYGLGFRTERLFMASVDLGLQGYEPEKSRRFLDELTERVKALPGVESAAIASSVPFDTFRENRSAVSADQLRARDSSDKDEALEAGVNRVDPGYFRTIGAPLLQGREFSVQDRDSAPRVAVVNEALADRLWPGQEALGKQFHWQSQSDAIEVIGVVRTGKYAFLGEAPRPFVYLPIAQAYTTPVTLHARTAMDDPLALVPALQSVFRDLDPDLPVYNVRTMEEHLRSSAFAFLPLRMGAFLAGAQGLVGLLLAVMGVYGVVSYSVSQQKRDIGIRVALGAGKLDVFRAVSRAGLRPAIVGLVLGSAAAFGLARLLAVLLYGIHPANIPVFTMVVSVMLGVSLLACWLPARRAARVDPVAALRQE